jgi:hypothetical protein
VQLNTGQAVHREISVLPVPARTERYSSQS